MIDAYAEMPGRGRNADRPIATDRVRMAYGGGMDTVVGWGSIAIPGAFAGFDIASRRYGNVPWSDLFHPSIALARDGFAVSDASAYYLTYAHDVIYGWDAETAVTYHRDDGTPVQAGDLVTIPDLAACLDVLAHTGARALYRGELAAALVLACSERGGLITEHDLEEYQPVVRPPARIRPPRLGHRHQRPTCSRRYHALGAPDPDRTPRDCRLGRRRRRFVRGRTARRLLVPTKRSRR